MLGNPNSDQSDQEEKMVHDFIQNLSTTSNKGFNDLKMELNELVMKTKNLIDSKSC